MIIHYCNDKNSIVLRVSAKLLFDVVTTMDYLLQDMSCPHLEIGTSSLFQDFCEGCSVFMWTPLSGHSGLFCVYIGCKIFH